VETSTTGHVSIDAYGARAAWRRGAGMCCVVERTDAEPV
jgi:hypothetical protein